ncbi:Co-chaperone GrpE family protein, putative isoform 1 [Hibiscus syriacus]|uniref:Co-chaperone GrpE family protein, putative isoform 1 n=1 Tax=Hibiscus syriacus TaxID=106335 RepID=A0A6A3AID9_HIBSY|nr:uncharacterized protein LOC120126413 [Hibiscus syriacus]KAE8704334.1 Co-chaperone GrpE family protein, putative isoform 1 [Hibiscus syriacus]
MEGVGSARLGRASARYGGSTAVFSGPVRKWRKKWVHVSPSSTAKHSQPNGNGSAASSILLCRWTPLSFAESGSSAVDGEGEEQQQPPKRKFRYTPVVMIEEERKKAAAKQVEDEAKADDNKTEQSPDLQSSKTGNELNMNDILKNEIQGSNTSNLDLGLCLKGHDGSRNSVGESVGQGKAASSMGFWSFG